MKKIFIIMLFFCSLAHAETDFDIYFNAGVEKYLQGDYSNSINNLNKALGSDPGNNSVKKLLLKVYLEAATKSSNEHKYPEAKAYLEEAKKIFPDDPRVEEMYRTIKGVLSRYDPGSGISSPEPANAGPLPPGSKSGLRAMNEEMEALKEAARPRPVKPELPAVKIASVRPQSPQEITVTEPRIMISSAAPLTPVIPERTKAVREYAQEETATKARARYGAGKTVKAPQNQPWVPAVELMPDKARVKPGKALFLKLYAVISSLAITFCVIFLLALKQQSRRRQALNDKKISGLVGDIDRLSAEKNKISYDLGLEKERCKTEQALNEKLTKELEWSRTQLEQVFRGKQSSGGGIKLPVPADIRKEAKKIFVEKQKEEIKNLSVDTGVIREESFSSQPVVEQTRERIAVMAQNIYEQSPETALSFLQEMAGDASGAVRSNVIRALGKIGSPETVEILLGLCADTDERVRRETIKSLKQLSQKIANNELPLPEEYKARIDGLVKKEYATAEWIF
jgi:hypothetical protein